MGGSGRARMVMCAAALCAAALCAHAGCAQIVGFGDLERVAKAGATSSAGVGINANIGLGTKHACAVMADETLRCWGLNDFGQLGVGDVANRATPTPVPGIEHVTF